MTVREASIDHGNPVWPSFMAVKSEATEADGLCIAAE